MKPEFRAYHTPQNATVMLVLWEDSMRSLAVAEASCVRGPGDWWVNRVLVTRYEDRGKGYGGQVLERLKEEVVAEGCTCLKVTPGGYDGNTEQQISFYEQHGFVRIQGDPETDFGTHWEWRPRKVTRENDDD